jgi:hypothetical protein
MKDYVEQLAEFVSSEPVLGADVANLKNLEGILGWAPTAGISLGGIDLLQQDEYSYDLFLPLADSRWLVFAVT